MGQIITPPFDRWGASDELLSIVAESTPENVLVNAGGEVIDRTPEELAAFISAGGVWVDYCGGPMVYKAAAGEDLIHIGPPGFSRFLTALGITLEFSFAPETLGYEFVYPRSLVVMGDAPANLVANKNAAYEVGEGYAIYSSFALLNGSGHYFYAYRDVDPVIYTNFIMDTLYPLGYEMTNLINVVMVGVVAVGMTGMMVKVVK